MIFSGGLFPFLEKLSQVSTADSLPTGLEITTHMATKCEKTPHETGGL